LADFHVPIYLGLSDLKGDSIPILRYMGQTTGGSTMGEYYNLH